MATWVQKTVTLAAKPRGLHLVTSEVLAGLPELRDFQCGLLHVFIQHTSASLTINENTDPDVRKDMEDILNKLVPESRSYRHNDEGPDDLPAHAKASLLGPSLSIPVSDGKLALGTWQGILLAEHRNAGGPRRLVLTLNGQRKA